MKTGLLLVIVIFAGMLSGTASGAIGIDTIHCDPDTGEIVSGTVIQASVTMDFIRSAGDQPGPGTVMVSTDLINPLWTVEQVNAGAVPVLLSTVTGGTLTLPADGGMPDETGKLTLLVTAKGIAPVVFSPENKDIIVITDLAGYNTIREPRLIVPPDKKTEETPASPGQESPEGTKNMTLTTPAQTGRSPATPDLSGNPVTTPEKTVNEQNNSGLFNGIVSAIKNALKFIGI